MVLEQCPQCGVRHVQTAQLFAQQVKAGDAKAFWFVLRCQNAACQRLVLVESDPVAQIASSVFPFVNAGLAGAVTVPQALRDDFHEAAVSLSAGCFKASLVMSRRVLQRCLADQGCAQNKLVDAINAAIANGVLRKAFHPLAEEIRQYGNLGAHPDDDNLTTADREAAQQVLEFARLLIHEFYELPATATALKLKRTP
jgi:hypothetical protein